MPLLSKGTVTLHTSASKLYPPKPPRPELLPPPPPELCEFPLPPPLAFAPLPNDLDEEIVAILSPFSEARSGFTG